MIPFCIYNIKMKASKCVCVCVCTVLYNLATLIQKERNWGTFYVKVGRNILSLLKQNNYRGTVKHQATQSIPCFINFMKI